MADDSSGDETITGSVNNSQLVCSLRYQHFVVPQGEIWCGWVWDSILCWPPARASTTTRQRCPWENGVDTTKFAERRCSDNGRWEGRDGVDGSGASGAGNGGSGGENHSGTASITDRPYYVDSPNGWTNYTPCFTPQTVWLLRKLYAGNKNEGELKLEIAERTRTLEFVGLSISLAALVISLAIFCRFRSLRNTRTRIHKNLFVAMVIQVVTRLTLYIDQALLRSGAYGSQNAGIENTPILCEASYVLLEYARTAMFMWMFIEGFFLHNMVTVTAFQETSYYRTYRLIGWGLPVIMTFTWAIVTARLYHPSKCWWGYNFTSYFWILEGPRMAVILLNFLFLMNIVRVLLKKLRESHTSEIEQVRKAVRAAVVLLPLLGITNIISMFDAPLDKTTWFALWSYTTHFLTSFQGLFIATLYCFLNGEVRLALDKTITVYLSLRGTDVQTRRQSTLSSSHQAHRITPVIQIDEEELRPAGSSLSMRFCCRGSVGDETTISPSSSPATAYSPGDHPVQVNLRL